MTVIDTEYQIERDALIPKARKYANEKVDGKNYPYKWNLIFFNKMDELAIITGLLPERGRK